MLSNPKSFLIEYQEVDKPFIPEGLEEAFALAEKATPEGEYFMVNIDQIIDKNKKVKGKTIIYKYDLPRLKAISETYFHKKFDVKTNKAEIVEYLRDPDRLEEIRRNPRPVRVPEKKTLKSAPSSRTTTPISSQTTTPISSRTSTPTPKLETPKSGRGRPKATTTTFSI